jgi:hypothetical protein
VTDVTATPLHKMRRQLPTVLLVFFSRQILRQVRKLWVQQGEEGAERLFIPTVRSGSDQFMRYGSCNR